MEELENIDFKELVKNCKTQDNLTTLTKQFKKMIENMLKLELSEHIENSEEFTKNGYYILLINSPSKVDSLG